MKTVKQSYKITEKPDPVLVEETLGYGFADMHGALRREILTDFKLRLRVVADTETTGALVGQFAKFKTSGTYIRDSRIDYIGMESLTFVIPNNLEIEEREGTLGEFNKNTHEANNWLIAMQNAEEIFLRLKKAGAPLNVAMSVVPVSLAHEITIETTLADLEETLRRSYRHLYDLYGDLRKELEKLYPLAFLSGPEQKPESKQKLAALLIERGLGMCQEIGLNPEEVEDLLREVNKGSK